MRHGSFEHAARIGALAVVVLMIGATLTGCGSMPTSPLADAGPNMGASATMDGAASATMPGDDGPGLEAPPISAPAPPPNALEVLAPFTPGTSTGMIEQSSNMSASTGGTLKNGRWTLDVPKSALEGDAQITLGVPSDKSWGCELQIAPADLNHFAVPVHLTVDCKGVSKRKLSKYVIFWYNPATRGWVAVAGSQVDTKKKTVTAPLSHFSIYAVAQSGSKI